MSEFNMHGNIHNREIPALDESIASLSDVIITPRILKRKTRGYTAGFDEAFQRLEECVELNDKSALQRICDEASKYCRVDSVGLSLLGYINDEPVFNLALTSGPADAMVGNMYSPRYNTPCGTVLEMYSYQVFRHPERHYRWVRENGIVVPEMITMPIYKEDMQPLGTFWLLHGEGKHFDGEDIRIISMLLSLINKAIRREVYRKLLSFTWNH